MTFNPEIHHRRFVRLKNYDYSWAGWYYVTVCTYNRECILGEIQNDAMVENELGGIVREEWLRTPAIRPNVELDEFVLMPNHLHGIVIINDPGVGATRRVAPTEDHTLKGDSLESTIGQVKSICTKRIKAECHIDFKTIWQRGFYEHIIRNDADLHRIRTYIQNNPRKWALDEENPSNHV